LLPEFQGKGLAKEAALVALRFAYEVLGWTTAVSCMDAANKPSIRLAEALGAVCEGRTEIRPYGEALLYRHRPPAELLATAGARSAA
jgi:RimJ/RimL family protein N-acetyltransferase